MRRSGDITARRCGRPGTGALNESGCVLCRKHPIVGSRLRHRGRCTVRGHRRTWKMGKFGRRPCGRLTAGREAPQVRWFARGGRGRAAPGATVNGHPKARVKVTIFARSRAGWSADSVDPLTFDRTGPREGAERPRDVNGDARAEHRVTVMIFSGADPRELDRKLQPPSTTSSQTGLRSGRSPHARLTGGRSQTISRVLGANGYQTGASSSYRRDGSFLRLCADASSNRLGDAHRSHRRCDRGDRNPGHRGRSGGRVRQLHDIPVRTLAPCW